MTTNNVTAIIKEIGRGKNAACDISREDARALFAAMLAGTVPPLQLGAVLMAFRIKGESSDELAGFLDAAHASLNKLTAPAGTTPLVIPAYNGARKMPNLTPLLAHLAAREGVPVLVHGVARDAARVTTCEIFAAMGVKPARDMNEAIEQLAERRLSFITIETLAPALAGLLALRTQLGVRGSGHTLVKMLQPFATPALRLVSVTHPDYLARMREFFTTRDGGALLLRGAEGEAVAHPRREPSILFADGRAVHTWNAEIENEPAMPDDRVAAVTAAWINDALAGRVAIPRAITHQAACCVRAAQTMNKH